ncbi:hypothetical protein AKJ09_11381 [Labilithrix luteola]|uniref:DoxX family protein n=1 Tax=Labilithrix luteola TaxID=1391654 RepID=A0A0K1QG82_9BACT|nr:DoxX family protein [Labilithrix luteola]AKV04718.1 hypothetical protein AKJ09_11381 [Labilithrix luteola]
MSATDTLGPDDVVVTRTATLYEPSRLQRMVATEASLAATVARLTLGIVVFPHAAQKVFGWFGGYGLSGTYNYFTTQVHIPGALAGLVIMVEFLSSVALIVGAFTRVAAVGILCIMCGAIVTVHAQYGFFMNWYGQQRGEGFEYHLLAIGLSLVAFLLGGGRGSVDQSLARGSRRELVVS